MKKLTDIYKELKEAKFDEREANIITLPLTRTEIAELHTNLGSLIEFPTILSRHPLTKEVLENILKKLDASWQDYLRAEELRNDTNKFAN